MFEKIRRFYEKGLWTAAMVRQAAAKGLLSEAQCSEIMGMAGAVPAGEAADNG